MILTFLSHELDQRFLLCSNARIFETQFTQYSKPLIMKKQLLSIIGVMALALTMTFTSCDDDPCKDVTCNNGGVCLDGLCDCSSTGYEGADCAVAWKDKYIGSYNATEDCAPGTYTTTIQNSSVSPSAPDVFLITNFGDSGVSATANANGDGTFTVPSFAVGTFTVSGNGSIDASGTTVTVTYTLSDATTTLTCTKTMVKI